ncbi:hypothetical protein [Desulfovibrio inopinatus]|uniref:hypothetical protein n=1 Tax=Desulfovibrio inopinatus TaxID=102109 RepID=UPI0003FAE074|nr:hypothetical protein [Desulfovibrio inopinatus]
MATVISIDAFRQKTNPMQPGAPPDQAERPVLHDKDFWSRDYSKLEHIVFGVLKISELLSYYVPYDDSWHFSMLCLLDAAYRRALGEETALADVSHSLKGYILDAMTAENKRDLSGALLILDLVEKSPSEKESSQH